MRDIRARIVQRHGIELSAPQIQELAARRLEAMLEPRNINPSLLEQLRKAAGSTADVPLPAPEPGYTFEDTTLYETHRGILRFIRKLLNPILKLFFNPAPLVDALHTQARLNAEAAAREAERERRQAEWNALHYELLQRMVTEVSRISIDMQALESRVESLAAKVDFNDRRVRGLESPAPHGRPQQPRAILPSIEPVIAAADAAPTDAAGPVETSGDGTRRRRRRRRGRRSGAGATDPQAVGETALAAENDDADAGDNGDGGLEGGVEEGGEPLTAEDETAVAFEPAHAISPLQPLEPHPTPVEPMSIQPEPPRDEPTPAAPTDHADPGPPDR
jgi:hypothetical protein